MEPPRDSSHQGHAGALHPVAVAGGLVAVGHRPIALKAPEMVDADHVVQLLRAAHPADPPAKAVPLHGVVAVQGISPELSVRGEIVRRDAGNLGGKALLIQLEHLRGRPGVGGVQRDIDGHIPDDADAQAVDIFFQLAPLLVEKELDIGKQLDVRFQLLPGLFQGLGFAQAQGLRPLRPGLHVILALQGHEQGVIRQPLFVLFLKGLYGLPVPLPAAFFGGCQDLVAVLVELAVIHISGVAAPIPVLHVLGREKTVGDQEIQVDIIGIAREGGKALIGRVSVAGGTQREHLPVRLARSAEKVREIISRLSKGTDAVGRRQGRDGHQYAAGSVHNCFFLLIFCC